VTVFLRQLLALALRPAVAGFLFRLVVLVLSPVVVWVVLLAFGWIDALLLDRRPVTHADGGADAGPPAPEPLPAAGVDPYPPNVVPLGEWRRRRATS
jgi:hypothetical protein